MSAAPEEHTVRSADGTRIGFVKLGSGPPLVLVHGSTDTLEGWLPVASTLADRFTCHVVDRRGRGRSGDDPAYALARECEDVGSVLERAGPGAHLLGHSYGGVCALEAARRFSVGRLVVYEPPLLLPQQRLDLLTAGYREALEKNEVEAGLTLFLTGGPGLTEDEVSLLRTTPVWQQMIEVAPTLTRELEAIRGLPRNLDRYRELSAPALLLVGTASSEELQAGSRALQQALPDARTILLEGQAHIANMLAPDLVAREAAEFLLATGRGVELGVVG